MGDAQLLNVTDAESVYDAIIDLILAFDNYPANFKPSKTNVLWNNSLTGVSIGLYPMQGAIYLKRYISGNYTAQFPFMIVFKSNPTSNDASIKAQILVDEIGKWLEKCAIGFKDEHLSFENMNRISPTYIFNKNDKSTEIAIEMQLKYSYNKKGR